MKIIKTALTLLIGFTILFMLFVPIVYIGNSDPDLDTIWEVAFKLTLIIASFVGVVLDIIFTYQNILDIYENN